MRCPLFLSSAVKHNGPLGVTVPKGPSGSRTRILPAGIAATPGSVGRDPRSTGQDADSQRRGKSRWKHSHRPSAFSPQPPEIGSMQEGARPRFPKNQPSASRDGIRQHRGLDRSEVTFRICDTPRPCGRQAFMERGAHGPRLSARPVSRSCGTPCRPGGPSSSGRRL